MRTATFAQRLLTHLRWKSVAELLSRAISLIFIFVTARTLGDTGYGAFSLPLAWAGLWAITLDWGTQHLLIRELGENASPWQLLPAAFYLKVLASLCFALGLGLSSYWAPQIPFHALAAAGLWSIAQSWNDSLFALLNAYEQFKAEALYRNGMRFVLLLPQLAILYWAPDVWTLLWVSAITQALLSVGVYGWVLRRVLRQNLPPNAQVNAQAQHKSLLAPHFQRIYALWRRGLSFWWFHVAWLMYLKLDLVMLPNFLSSATETSALQTLGWYQGAIRCYEIVALVGYILSMSLYPLWVRMEPTARQQFWKRLNRWLWPATLVIAVLAYVVAPLGVPLLLGQAFTPTIGLFRILSLSLPFVIFNQIALNVLAAQHRQYYTAWAASLGLFINGALNAYAIPRYGATAAAWSTVVADLCLSLCFLVLSFWPNPQPDR